MVISYLLNPHGGVQGGFTFILTFQIQDGALGMLFVQDASAVRIQAQVI